MTRSKQKNNIEKTLPSKGDLSERNKLIKLASETAEEEKYLELGTVYDEYKDEQRKGYRGTFDEYLDRRSVSSVRRIKLKDGGSSNESSFAQLADDYEDDIEVIYLDGTKEDFGSYVKRMGGVVYDAE